MLKAHMSAAKREFIFESRSKCIFWLAHNLLWNTFLGPDVQWREIYGYVLHSAVRDAWAEAPDDNSIWLKTDGRFIW